MDNWEHVVEIFETMLKTHKKIDAGLRRLEAMADKDVLWRKKQEDANTDKKEMERLQEIIKKKDKEGKDKND